MRTSMVSTMTPMDPAASAAKSATAPRIGSDGLILILLSPTADARMRMFNADGSEGEMCGNGLRCAKYVHDHGIAKTNIEDRNRPRRAQRRSRKIETGKAVRVRVDMARADPASLGHPDETPGKPSINVPLTVDGRIILVPRREHGQLRTVIFDKTLTRRVPWPGTSKSAPSSRASTYISSAVLNRSEATRTPGYAAAA